MCFYNNYKDDTAKIAAKDIECFKALKIKVIDGKRCILSPYRLNVWEVNKPKTARIIRFGKPYSLDKGLHSCKSYTKATLHGKNIFAAIIPAGTVYWENEDEYVSEKLIILKKTSLKQ